MDSALSLTGTLKVFSVPQSSTQLGLVVKFVSRFPEALVKYINPELRDFADQVAVGDRIVTNNGRQVKYLDDLKAPGTMGRGDLGSLMWQ